MPYFLLMLGILIGIYWWWENRKQRDLKKHGIRVLGTIVENRESSPNSKYRLGGNINNPTIKFLTESGEEIIGRPITGFISQKEVSVPSNVYIFYDRRNPNKFYLEMS